MPRLVRRRPLSERLANWLNPGDLLLWLSEELNSNDWEEFAKDWALPVGFGVNVVFMIARANSGPGRSSSGGDGVFMDDSKGSGWGRWLSTSLVLTLTLLSLTNASYTFLHKRAYRLFEFPIDDQPSTPSAQRVAVDPQHVSSAPSSPSLFQTLLGSSGPESRIHPDPAQHVWEVKIWDPPTLCLRLFCLFSPGHVLIYWLFLPTAALDARPSVTVATTALVALLLSVQLSVLANAFAQKAYDDRFISKEVLKEYDAKFVHPSLNRPSRDVGVQADLVAWEDADGKLPGGVREVDLYSPRFIINRGFRTNPNPNYATHYDRENVEGRQGGSGGAAYQQQVHRRQSMTPSLRTPANPVYPGWQQQQQQQQQNQSATSSSTALDSSPLRPPPTAIKQINPFRAPASPEKRSSDGGNLGVYSHANSPLRKAVSNPYLRNEHVPAAAGNGDVRKRGGSPLKRVSVSGGGDYAGQGGKEERRGRGYGGLGAGRRESGRF